MSTRPSSRDRSRGQSLTEFAFVFPVFMLVVAGLIQYGTLFWAQNTLTQVVRDTGRWAASQRECGAGFKSNVVSTAQGIAKVSALIGYTDGTWSDGTHVTVTYDPPSGCVPSSNAETAWVDITITHKVPVFLPLIVPGDGNISTGARFRMEPCSGSSCPTP